MANLKNTSEPQKPNSLTSPAAEEGDEVLDTTLRPKTWEGFIGQEKIKENLRVMIGAARKRRDSSCDHILFYGNSGLGKTTLSCLMAKEMKSSIKTVAGPSIKKTGDLAAILTNLEEGDILFCDEFHRMNKMVEEFLYPALEDFKLNLVLGKGPMARTMNLELPRFTFIAATTRIAMISNPLRNRFGAIFRLNFYNQKEIEEIIRRSARSLKISIDLEAIKIIAQASRLTPRVANRLLKRVRDFAQVEEKNSIDREITEKALEFLEIDRSGLEPGDRKILSTIIDKFRGGPVGLQTLSAATSEEEDTILDIYEPYLLQLGFIERTPRGRMATESAYKYLKISYKEPPKLI